MTAALVRSGPLAGLRVLELGGIGPGPFATMMLADYGADVARVDRPGEVPQPGAEDPRTALLHRGKRSVLLDLKDPQDRDEVLRLAARADVVVEGFRPGVAERLGVGPQECMRSNPRLVYGRMTGWGQYGPLSSDAGHDIDYIALTGALDAIGPADRPPVVPLNLLGDFGGGALYLVAGLLAALFERYASGLGQVVDAAISDGVAHLTTMQHALSAAGVWQPQRGSNLLDGSAPFYSTYRTADGCYLAVGAVEAQFYSAFLRVIELDLPVAERMDRSRWALWHEAIAVTVEQRTLPDWLERFAGADACVTPVLGFGDAADHPHMRARQTYIEVDGIVQPAPAPRFSRTPGAVASPPPTPGEHSAQIRQTWEGPASVTDD